MTAPFVCKKMALGEIGRLLHSAKFDTTLMTSSVPILRADDVTSANFLREITRQVNVSFCCKIDLCSPFTKMRKYWTHSRIFLPISNIFSVNNETRDTFTAVQSITFKGHFNYSAFLQTRIVSITF